MNCNQVKDNLSAFIDNEMKPDEINAIKAHLIRCKSCREKRDQIEKLGQSIRQIPPLTTSPEFQFKVYSAIRRKEASRSVSRFRKWQTVFLPFAAMIAGIFIGVSSDSFLSGNGVQPGMVAATSSDEMTRTDQTASTQFAGMVTGNGEENVIRNYNLDSYIRRPLVPVSVDSIPEDPDSTEHYTNSNNYTSSTQPRYVLDNVPMRVSYERTIY